AGEGDEGAFLIGAGERADFDVSQVGRQVAELLGGRGGGSGRVFQGKATRLSRRDEAAALTRGLRQEADGRRAGRADAGA
ncbi:MAG TPA: hypothetical protein VJ997_11725, partial [Longimicrobiales bacterium]|nr:hypothetical protein [Longimicrobiales bacterium]